MLAELESQTATRDVHAIIYWKINKLLQKIIYYKAFYLRQYLHRGEAVLRKHLRTFEENQISNFIRKTKGKRRLKFHQFYSAKNTRRDTRKPRKPFFPN